MFKNPFREATADELAEKQLRKAKMDALDHEAYAEHHRALATMYRERIARLNNVVPLPQGKAR